MNYLTKFAVGGAAVAFLAVAYVVGGKTDQPQTVPVATGPTAAEIARAQQTKLRPDLDAHEYWTLRCRPYRERAEALRAKSPESMDTGFAAAAMIYCTKHALQSELNSTAAYREFFEKGNDGNRLLMPAEIAGRAPPPVHVARDGCDMAGAIPNCKEEMAKLMASRPIMSGNNRTPEAVSRNVQPAQAPQEPDMWQTMRAKTDSIARACGGRDADDIATIGRTQAGRNCIDAHTGSMFGTD